MKKLNIYMTDLFLFASSPAPNISWGAVVVVIVW